MLMVRARNGCILALDLSLILGHFSLNLLGLVVIPEHALRLLRGADCRFETPDEDLLGLPYT